jgi:LysM repeat protein
MDTKKLFLFDEDNGAELYAARRRAAEGKIEDEFAAHSSVDMPATTSGRVDPNNYRVPERTYNGYSVFVNNRTHYVVARDGDSFSRIASTFGLTERTLRKYNEISPKSVADPIEGELIYIEQKQSQWLGDKASHIVLPNETPTSVAQMYAIRLKRLLRLNHLKRDAVLTAGQSLKLN